MNEDEQVIEETLQTSAESEPNTENQDSQVEQAQESSEEVEEVVPKSDYEKQVELANNYKVRAEKAEKKAKETKPAPQTSLATFGTSPTDLYALLQAAVPQEDIAEVTDYAKLKGISVTEALKSSVVKNILAEKAENRKVAAATNIGTTRRNSGQVSGETLLENARSKGEIPDSDAALEKLIDARLGARKSK